MRWGLTVISGLLWAVVASAQQPTQDPADPGISVQVSPATIPVNGTVTITGLGYPQPGQQFVVTIVSPASVTSSFNVVPDTKGKYQAVFYQTPVEGDYRVSVKPGGKGTGANATFSAHSYLIDIDEDVADNKALLNESLDIIRKPKKILGSVPDSPAKTQLEAKLDQLEKQAEDLPKQAVVLQTALGAYKSMVTANPQSAALLQPVFDHLAHLAQKQKTSQEEIDKEIQASQKTLNGCDTIDQASIALRAVPDMMSLLTGPMAFLESFAQNVTKAGEVSLAPEDESKQAGAAADAYKLGKSLEKGDSGAASAAAKYIVKTGWEQGTETQIAANIVAGMPGAVKKSDAWKFVVAETKKRLPDLAQPPHDAQGAFKLITTIAGDALAFANDEAFAKYCEKFEGNFKATMEAHFFTKPNDKGNITEWWSYTTAISGKITLRYPKGEKGKAVALSGQLEGGATHFTYKEDVWNANIFGKIAKGGIVHTLDLPAAASDDATGGFVNSLASPSSFFIPLTGQFVDGKIKITMGAARSDFNLSIIKAHSFYVVQAPVTLMLPVYGHFDLPYTDAHFLLDHFFKAEDEYPVTVSGQSMSIQSKQAKPFPGNGNLAKYTLDLTACNPGCAK